MSTPKPYKAIFTTTTGATVHVSRVANSPTTMTIGGTELNGDDVSRMQTLLENAETEAP